MNNNMEELTEDSAPIEALPDTNDDMDAESPAIQDVSIVSTTAKPAENDELSGDYLWHLTNATRQQGEKLYSEKFEIGTHIWRLLVFPRGNQKKPFLALYLESPEAPITPISMAPRATFSLSIVNQVDETKTWTKEATHLFGQQESDWGFTETLNLSEVYSPTAGFLVNDTLIFRVHVQVHKDERYDSRKETGYVGLKNQGATCYMNSLLQYLYNIPYFRKAVYHMPTSETDEASKNMPLALQSLFYRLQYSRTTVSTKDLTKSFGWGTYDAFMQHDVQELNRVLCEKLEEKMKGTRVERCINELFEGHTLNFIKCINVNYSSERKESFMDLQLDVKGCTNIYDSFDRYVDIERLEGDNKYLAEGHGLQDATKGVLFLNLPPVLQLQLKRFEYDFQRDTMVKINDRYEFPDELDLDREDGKYFAAGADRSVRNTYKLHSVLVHSGGVHGGHYYAFVRPDGQTWLRFDDERVTVETAQRAMDDQYGGDDDGMPGVVGGYPIGPTNNNMNSNNAMMQPAAAPLRFPKHSNAYMLVYVRLADWDRLICSVDESELPMPLGARLRGELEEKERRQKEKQEAHLYVSIKIATDLDIASQLSSGQRSFDLVDHDLLPPERLATFRMRKHLRFTDVKRMVAETLGVPESKQRYWAWVRRPNGTYRVSRTLSAEEEQAQLMDLKDLRDHSPLSAAKHALMDIRLYLETPKPWHTSKDIALQPNLHERTVKGQKFTEVFLFAKLYDPLTEKLTYIGRGYAPLFGKISEVGAHFRNMAGLLPEGTDVDVYEEVKREPTLMVEKLKGKNTIDVHKLEDGDILVIQRRLSAEEQARCRHPTIVEYLQYVQQRRLVRFKKLEEPEEEGFTLELRQDMNYDQVTQALAEHLGMVAPGSVAAEGSGGAMRLRLTQHSQYSHAPQKQPLRWRGGPSLQQMLTFGTSGRIGSTGIGLGSSGAGGANPNDILYYEVLDIPLEQLEQLKTLKVHFHKEGGDPVSEHVLRLPRDAKWADVLDKLAAQLAEQEKEKEKETDGAAATTAGNTNTSSSTSAAAAAAAAGRPMRLMEITQSKIYKVLDPSETVGSIDDSYWRLRAEVVPPEEEGLVAVCRDNQQLLSSSSSRTTTSLSGSIDLDSPQLAADRLLCCYHFKQAANSSSAQPAAALPAGPLRGPLQQPGNVASTGPAPMDTSTGTLPDQATTGDSGVQGPPSSPTSRPAAQPGPLAPAISGQLAPGASVVQGAVTYFGEPILVRCGPHDTLGVVRKRIQAKLGLSDEELAKWRWVFSSSRGGPPLEYLCSDEEDVGARLTRGAQALLAMGASLTEHAFLGMEHEDDKPRVRPVAAASRLPYERPVKIYG